MSDNVVSLPWGRGRWRVYALNDAVNAERLPLQYLVFAATEAEAREAAARQAGSEGANYWRDPVLSGAHPL